MGELKLKGIDVVSIPDEWWELREPLGMLIKAEEEFRNGVIDTGGYETLRRKCIESIREIVDRRVKAYRDFISGYLAKIIAR